MKRPLNVAALITALAACGPRAGAGAQPGGGVPSALDEAARLDAMVEKLFVTRTLYPSHPPRGRHSVTGTLNLNTGALDLEN